MSSRPSSRTAAGEDSASTLRTSTVKRPVTRPVAPRLSSTTGTATRPTLTSATRTSSTTSSSLSKPPTRSISTTSTVKRPPSSTATTSSSLHRVRPSSASVEVSGDESKRDGITAKPKRMSTTSTSSTTRPTSTTSGIRTATPTSSTTTVTPVRRTTTSTTSTTAKPSVRSPTSTTKTTTPSTTRPTSTLTSRARTSAVSTIKPVSTLAERKRLSTIPASPAAKNVSEEADENKENKENEVASESGKVPVRPALGTRTSTRSVMIEQQIHEFDIVNQMLRSAMTIDGMESDEEEQVREESKQVMAKLRSDLAKVRVSEKDYGRLPTEAELAEIDDVPQDEESQERVSEDSLAAGSEITILKGELEGSRVLIKELQSHLTETKARMEHFSKSAEQESEKVNEALENIRTEHRSKIEEISALHKVQIESLESSHQGQMEELLGRHQTEVDALQSTQHQNTADRDAEIDALKAELETVKAGLGRTKTKASSAVVNDAPRDAIESDTSELAEVKKQLQAQQERHSAAKDNAKMKMAKVLEECRKQMQDQKTQHAEEIAAMQKRLDDPQGNPGHDDEELLREKEAHAKTLQQLQAIRTELESVEKSKLETDGTHLKSVQQLKGQIGDLEKLRAESTEQASRSNVELKAEHEKQYQTLQSQLEAAQDELKKSSELIKQHDSEAEKKLKNELRDAQEQAAIATRTQADAIEKRLQEANAAAKIASETYDLKLQKLQDQLNEAIKVSAAKESEHAQQLKSLQSILQTKNTELETLGSEYDQKLIKTRTDNDSAREAELKVLNQAHTDQIKELEEQSQSALHDLEGLETSNAAHFEKIQSDANVAREAALKEQATSHQSTVSRLEGQLSSLQKNIAELEQSYGSEVDKLRAEHLKDKDIAIASLTSDHKQKLAEHKSQHEASDNAFEVLKTSHAEALQKHEAKTKSIADELGTAKFQVQTIKGILQSVEQESQEKIEEHQKELEKRDNDFSQAVMKLSSQSMRIAELETAHKQAIEQAKAAVAVETQGSLDALKHEHDEAFTNLRRELEDKHNSTLESLRSEHSVAVEAQNLEVNARDHDIEKLKAEHIQALTDLRSAAEEENTDVIDKVKRDHTTALDDLRSTLQSIHDEEFKTLHDQHSSKMEETNRGHEASLKNIQAEREDIVGTLTSELQQVRDKLRDTSEVEALKSQISASEQALTKLQEEQAATIASLTEQHASEVTKLQDEFKAVQSEVQRLADPAEFDRVRSELAETKAKIAELTQTHADDIASKDIEHFRSMIAFQSRLEKYQEAASSAAQTADEIREVKNLLVDAKRTISELSEQYAMATTDAEDQRVAAESAKRELLDLKKSFNEVRAVPEPVTESSKFSAKTANGTSDSLKSSPQAGLKASKWATADPEQSTTDLPASPSNDILSQGLGLHAETATESAAVNEGQQSSKPKQRNVAGQMAGIQEHIRQLTEMNDEFLQDHQKWARSLSRVDDDGNVTAEIEEHIDDEEMTK